MLQKPTLIKVSSPLGFTPHPELNRIFEPIAEAELQDMVHRMSRGEPFKPLLVDDQGRILAGEENWLAARRLGWEDISVITAPPMTASQLRSVIVSENVAHREIREEHLNRGMNNFFDMEPLRPRGGW